jgi:hypothetical protein
MKTHPFLKKFLLLGILTFLFVSCSNDAAEKKKMRNKWYEYFFAFVERAHMGLGTDSTVVEFQNHTNYTVDSVAVIFSNKGLFANNIDTLYATNIRANAHKQMVVPYHKMGITKTAQIIFIRSKELDFRFSLGNSGGKTEDPYYFQ